MDEQKCRAFLAKPNVNPITGRTITISPGKGVYGKLEKECLRIIGVKPTVPGAVSHAVAAPVTPILAPSQSASSPIVYKPGFGVGPIKATTPGYLKPTVPIIPGKPLASISPIASIGTIPKSNLLPVTPTVETSFIPRAGPIGTGLTNPLVPARMPVLVGTGLGTRSPFVINPGLGPIKPISNAATPSFIKTPSYSEHDEILAFIEETLGSYDYERLGELDPDEQDFILTWDDFLDEQRERVSNLPEEDIEFANTLIDYIRNQKVACLDKEGGVVFDAEGFYLSEDRFVIFNSR